MKRAASLPILLGLSAVALAQTEPPKIPQPDLTGLEPVKVVRIVDGDTLVVGEDGAEKKIRLLAVDAPESKQPGGSAATRFLKRLLEGERVFVVTDPKNEKDRYGRTLAYLYRAPDGLLFVNLEVVRQGYGRVYREVSFEHRRLFEHYEGVAVAAVKGVWLGLKPKAEPEPKRSTAGRSARQQPRQQQPKQQSVTVYVTKTGKKYHRGSCSYLRRSKIPLALEQAKRGYSPCSRCSPP